MIYSYGQHVQQFPHLRHHRRSNLVMNPLRLYRSVLLAYISITHYWLSLTWTFLWSPLFVCLLSAKCAKGCSKGLLFLNVTTMMMNYREKKKLITIVRIQK